MNWKSLKNKIKFFPRNLLIIIIFLSFFINLIYAFSHRIAPAVDALAYDQIAVNLTEGFGYREDRNKSYEFDIAIVRAGPAYEFFLAGIYKIFGHHYETVWVIQALLHSLTALVLFFIGRRVFKEERAGLFAAMLFGFHPDLIEISAMLMTETFYLFFISLLMLIFTFVFYHPKNFWLSAFLGLASGLSILTRPTVILFVPLAVFFYFFKKQYCSLIYFCLFLAVVLAPWTIRNYIQYHQFILTTLTGEYNLWVGNTLLADGGQLSGGYNPFDAYVSERGLLSVKQQASREFWFFALNYPLVFVKLCFLRVIRYFSLIRPMGFWFYQSGIKQLLFVSSSFGWGLIFFISGYSGLIVLWREWKALFNYFIVFALLAPLPLILTVVQSRYRFQIYPFLAVFGGYFISRLFEDRKTVKKYLQIAIIVLLIVSLLDAAYFLPLIKERLGLFL